ncbi:MAG: CTP synthase [Alphaproteobacteria bacterium]|nr:MAG: CTP synthase [Alphaproteobacteria bacterium]
MTKFVFITGGVVSSLGKGLTSASLGALLQARGFSVRLRKLDPYLNVDPGTMSPFEHGEVFVTDDGAETDLDLGHYERFTGVAAKSTDSISSGRIYSTVLERERKGDYLGETIQVIPHVTNEIKRFLDQNEDEVDFMLCEIGGTIGDIEGLPFFEAIRQFSQEKSRFSCIFVHLTLVPFLSSTSELKTKPTQHSVKELRSIGISPDILVCRSEVPIPSKEKAKIALFCNVDKKNIIAANDLETIYEAPLAFFKEGLDEAVLQVLNLKSKSKPDLSIWNDVSSRYRTSEGSVKIAVVGKYTQLEDAYKSLSEALIHGGLANKTNVEITWLESEEFEKTAPTRRLNKYDGILIPGGFGKRGTEGKIKVIKYAREKQIPFLGICLGMQLLVIEYARNCAGIKEANSEEFEEESNSSSDHLIYHLSKWIKDQKVEVRSKIQNKGGTMRLGAYPAKINKGTMAFSIYKNALVSERHRHRFEVNIKFQKALEESGLTFSGFSQDGSLPEIVELSNHPFFLGVQFHPELKSKPFEPHPIFSIFIKKALEQTRLV